MNPGDSLKAAPCIKAKREAEQMFDYWVTSRVSTFDNLNKTQLSFTKQLHIVALKHKHEPPVRFCEAQLFLVSPSTK